jgi:hypothetical protein
MFRSLRHAWLALFLIPAAFAQPATAQGSPIVGAWITTAWDGVAGEPQPGLLVFTETNYSMMFVPPGAMRETWATEDPTDAEVLAAFNSLVANSGRYTWTGNEFTTEAYVALNPNYMANWGENHVTYRFSVDGDTLTVTWPDDFGAGAGGAVGTFRRVGSY